MRVPNLHESDPYWDNDLGFWRRTRDGKYDDEANDKRSNNEKYSDNPLMIYLMLFLFIILIVVVFLLVRSI